MFWRGGKSKKYWQSGDKNKNPGRLSDLCHVIYKKSNESLKKAKLNLALMLKDGFLKENIDGEALLFASKRLCALSENRKILIIISDGAPIDDSTNSNNDNKNILIDHLHQVITTIQKKSNIEIIAIGIGHDVGEFYQNSITIKKTEELGDVLIKKLLDIL
jgi:cobaltochelatase CobT